MNTPLQRGDLISVAAGVPPAVEPGILPGGLTYGVPISSAFRVTIPGGKMPPSTAAKMAATTAANRR